MQVERHNNCLFLKRLDHLALSRFVRLWTSCSVSNNRVQEGSAVGSAVRAAGLRRKTWTIQANDGRKSGVVPAQFGIGIRRGDPMPATKRRTTKELSTGRSRSSKKPKSSSKPRAAHRWISGVHTESTFPREGLFNKDARTIARDLASQKTSPKGPASGMRMLTYYINRAGRNLSATRKRELERAKQILLEIIARTKK